MVYIMIKYEFNSNWHLTRIVVNILSQTEVIRVEQHIGKGKLSWCNAKVSWAFTHFKIISVVCYMSVHVWSSEWFNSPLYPKNEM